MTFNSYKTANLAKWTLLADISAAATSMILQTWQGGLFPSVFPYLDELVSYDATSSLENKPVLKREIGNLLNGQFGAIANRKKGLQDKVNRMNDQISQKERQIEKKEEMFKKYQAKLGITREELFKIFQGF